MRLHSLATMLGLIALLTVGKSALADITENDLDAFLPREEALGELKKKIDADPENHNNYFAYVELADALGRLDQMAWAYDQLLAVDPNLDSVRLDLSLVYVKLGRFKDAHELLNMVLAKNPPRAVQQDIRNVLAKIDEAERRNHFTGSMMVGIGYDSNATAAPNSGNVLVVDTLVPLGQKAKAQGDWQAFTALALGHAYDVGHITEDYAMRWQSSAITYLTRQGELSDLNLRLYGVRSGPELIYKPLEMHFTLLGGYNFVQLDAQSYLRNPNVELAAEFPLFAKLRGRIATLVEYRQFLNSDAGVTYSDRSGKDWQTQASLSYPFSEHSLWEGIFTLRREEAKRNFNANKQAGVTLSDTYNFSPDMAYGLLTDMFTAARAGYRDIRYDTADLLTSAKTRNDNERSVQLMLGRALAKDMFITAAYSYTDMVSNIENYRYINNRYTLSLTKNF